MAITNEFREAVSGKQIMLVRIMLKDIMIIDPSLKTFNEMLSYAEKNIEELYDEHDGESFNMDSSQWTEDYMNEQMVTVVSNFSKERIDLLQKIVKKIYAKDIEKKYDNESNKTSGLSNKQIGGIALAAVGGVAVAGGLCTSNEPVAVLGSVAVLGGIALVLAGREN